MWKGMFLKWIGNVNKYKLHTLENRTFVKNAWFVKNGNISTLFFLYIDRLVG